MPKPLPAPSFVAAKSNGQVPRDFKEAFENDQRFRLEIVATIDSFRFEKLDPSTLDLMVRTINEIIFYHYPQYTFLVRARMYHARHMDLVSYPNFNHPSNCHRFSLGSSHWAPLTSKPDPTPQLPAVT